MNKFIYMKAVFIFLAFVSALGVAPYGLEFSSRLFKSNHHIELMAGILFSVTALLLNMVLGYYSLTKMINMPKTKAIYFIRIIAFIGSIPIGFICYYGYANILPKYLSILISVFVILVNAAIGQLGLSSLLASIEENIKKFLASYPENILRLLGFFIGVIASTVSFLAAFSGLSDIVAASGMEDKYHVIGFFAFMTWLPVAALFSNSTQDAFSKFKFLPENYTNSSTKKITLISFLFVICLVSGIVYAQMTHDFFNIQKTIPNFFKLANIQFIAYYIIEPLAVLASGMVNFTYLNKLLFNNQKD